MSIVKVGVLRGGPSKEYDMSLMTGKHILEMLSEEPLCRAYKGVDIFIDKKGTWHIDGAPMTPEQALRRVDVIFNATKGSFEKDGVENGGDGNGGKLQRLLETFAVPFVGTKAYGSGVAQNKALAKEHFKKHGIKTPYFKELNIKEDTNIRSVAHDLFRSFPMPVVVKPRGLGSSIGISYASNMAQLEEAIATAREYSDDILVEEYLSGKEIISGFIDDFRGKDVYPLFPVEVKPHKSLEDEAKKEADAPMQSSTTAAAPAKAFGPIAASVAAQFPVKPSRLHSIFDWAAKQTGKFDFHSPARLTPAEKKQIEEAVLAGREALGLRHFATADFMVHPRRGVYLLEINAEPSLHEHSPIYKALEAGGIKKHEFLAHLLKLALGGEK